MFCFLSVTFCLFSVSAQDDDSANVRKSLPVVYVNAEKRLTAMQSLPYSISALSGRDVRNFRMWDLKQLTSIVPNLYSADPGDGRNVTSIRGIVSSSYDPAVVTYIDGVNQFTLDTYIPQLNDIKSIEVLRGPQGTLYGRNAMGGVINVTTNQPNDNTTLTGEISIGKYSKHIDALGEPDQMKYRAVVNFKTPVVKNKFLLGASFLYENSDGYYFNLFTNRKFDKQHQFGGNYFLKYILNPKWTITLNVKHLENRNNGAFPLVTFPYLYKYVVNQNAGSQLVDNVLNSSLSLNYSGIKFNFNSQLSYQGNYRYYDRPIDGDFSEIDGITIINNYGRNWNNVKVLTEEFRFTSPDNSASKLKWIAGGYLFLQNVPNKQAVHFGEDAAMLGSPDKNYQVINTTEAKNYGIAFFGKATYSVTPRTEIAIGLRQDYQHQKQSILGEYQPDGSPSPVFNTQDDTSATSSYSALSPTVSFLQRLNENSSLYLVYSRGFRTGGFTQLGLDPSQPPLFSFKPEYSNNFEVGLKNDFLNNKLRINLALFYTSVTNVQVPTLILPDAITVTRNAGKLHSKGFELEVQTTPVPNMEIVWNFGYTNSKYKELKIPSSGAEIDMKGESQIFTPNYTSMLAIQQAIPLNEKKSMSLFMRGEWMLIGEQHFDLFGMIEQSPYDLVNFKTGVTFKHFDVMLWMRNALKTKYISYAYDFGAIHYGEPRIFGVSFIYR